MEYTKEDIYRAITKAISSIETGHMNFMCTALERHLKCEGVDNLFKIVPELLEYKPEDKKISMCWFPSTETKKRIIILTELKERFK